MALKSIKNWFYNITGNKYIKAPNSEYNEELTDKQWAQLKKIEKENGWDIDSLKQKGFKKVGKSAW